MNCNEIVITERNYGHEYAEDNNFDGPVNIDEMTGHSTDIPEGDYIAMKAAGIKNPSAREYWKGFNSFFD